MTTVSYYTHYFLLSILCCSLPCHPLFCFPPHPHVVDRTKWGLCWRPRAWRNGPGRPPDISASDPEWCAALYNGHPHPPTGITKWLLGLFHYHHTMSIHSNTRSTRAPHLHHLNIRHTYTDYLWEMVNFSIAEQVSSQSWDYRSRQIQNVLRLLLHNKYSDKVYV